VPRAEEVDTGREGDTPLRSHDDTDEVPVAVRFHEGYDRADGAEGESHLACGPPGLLPQVGEEPALDRACNVPALPAQGPRLSEPRHGAREFAFRPRPVCRRRCGDVEGNDDVAPYLLLEPDDLLVRQGDVAIDRELECTGVRHYQPVEPEHAVEAGCEGPVPELPALREYVCVRDEALGTEVFHLCRENQAEVWVDNGQEEGCPGDPIPDLQPAQAPPDILLEDFEKNGHLARHPRYFLPFILSQWLRENFSLPRNLYRSGEKGIASQSFSYSAKTCPSNV